MWEISSERLNEIRIIFILVGMKGIGENSGIMWQAHLPLRRTKGFSELPAQLSSGLSHSLKQIRNKTTRIHMAKSKI